MNSVKKSALLINVLYEGAALKFHKVSSSIRPTGLLFGSCFFVTMTFTKVEETSLDHLIFPIFVACFRSRGQCETFGSTCV